jgi:hypothetical protein
MLNPVTRRDDHCDDVIMQSHSQLWSEHLSAMIRADKDGLNDDTDSVIKEVCPKMYHYTLL